MIRKKFQEQLKNKKKAKKNKPQESKKYDFNKVSFNLTEVIVIIIIALLFGGVIGSLITISKTTPDDYLEEFYETYNNVTNEYYKKVNKKKLVNAAIEGMINYLGDPYSTYMDEAETDNFNNTVNGSYKGIGVTVSIIEDKPTIISMFDSSPAKKAGMKVDDVITKVNGKSVKGKSIDKIVEMIKKKDNVTITVLREDKEHTFKLKLTSVTLPSVDSKIIEKDDKKVGVISISVFAANTYNQFSSNLESLEKKKIDSLIIDVRDNPGGHLTQVTKILSLFLDKKKVLYQIESDGKKTKVYSSTNEKRNYKIAVLINKNSASASEILAGAMKESYNAAIVGEKSYGKGTVQKEYSLSSGSSIKYTTEKWLTPKGHTINKKGITPTIEVSLEEVDGVLTEEKDNQLQTALSEIVK